MTSALYAFAGEEKINQQALDAFQEEFSNVEEVNWVAHKDFYEVSFSYQGKKIFAFYNSKGSLLGVMHYMLSTELPDYLQNQLKKYYPGYWIADLFEMKKDGSTNYYITLQDANKKIVLESRDKDRWEIFKEF